MIFINLFIFLSTATIALSVLKDHARKASNTYIDLMINLKIIYNATSIYTIYDDFQESIHRTTAIRNAVKQLSKRGTLSQVMFYSDLTKNYNDTLSKYPRQLFIVPMENQENVEGFSKFTKYHILSYHVWFIIFWGPVNKVLQDICKKPDANKFHLKFDTRMLVKCYDDPILREWYSVRYSTSILTNDLMEWNPQTGLKVKSNENLYQRRYDAAGTILKVSTIREHPKALINWRHGEKVAMFTKMMIELASNMNFILDFTEKDNFYGLYNETNHKWSGILGRLQSYEIDIAVSEITMTKERMDAFDFACPLILSRSRLFIKESSSAEVQWNAYLKAFSHKIWVSLVLLILLSTILLTYMKSKLSKVDNLKNFLIENNLHILGIYCQQGLPEFPAASSLRVAYVSIFFSAIILSAVYSASIISYLTIITPTSPFNTLSDFVNDGSYQLIVIRNTAEHEMFKTSQDKVLKRMYGLMKTEDDLPTNEVEAFYQVCSERVAFYSNGAIKRKIGDAIPCKLVDTLTGSIDNLAIALTKNNPFTEFINYNILRFQDNGIMRRMKQMFLKEQIQIPQKYNSVGIWGIAPLMTILSFGMIISILLLFIEKIHHKITNHYNVYNSRDYQLSWYLLESSQRKRNEMNIQREGRKFLLYKS